MSDVSSDASAANTDARLAGLSWPLAPQFILPIAVKSSDIDDFKHVNNVVYLGWMARCAWAHSKALGFDFAAFETHDCGFVVVRHELDYHAAALPDETVAIATWLVENDKRLRLSRRFVMQSVERDLKLASGVTRFAAMQISSGKACRMPAAYAEGYPVDTQAQAHFGPL